MCFLNTVSMHFLDPSLVVNWGTIFMNLPLVPDNKKIFQIQALWNGLFFIQSGNGYKMQSPKPNLTAEDLKHLQVRLRRENPTTARGVQEESRDY